MAAPGAGPARPGPEEDRHQAGAQEQAARLELAVERREHLEGLLAPVPDQGLWQVVPPDLGVLPELPLAELGARWAARAQEVVQGLGPVEPPAVVLELAESLRQAQQVPPAGVLELAQALREVAQQVGAQVAALAAALELAVARVTAQLVPQFQGLVQALQVALEQAADLEAALERGSRPAVALAPDLALADPGELALAGLAGVLAPRNQEARPEEFLARADQVLADQEELRAAALEQAALEERAVPWADPGAQVLADLVEAGRHWADLVDSGQADLVGEADQVAFLRQAAAELVRSDREAHQGVPARPVAPGPALPAGLAGEEHPGESPGQEALLAGRPLAPGLVVVQRVGRDPVIQYPSGAELDLAAAAAVERQVEAHPGLAPHQQAVYRDLLASSRQLEQAECPDQASVYRHHLAGLAIGDPRALLRGLPGV